MRWLSDLLRHADYALFTATARQQASNLTHYAYSVCPIARRSTSTTPISSPTRILTYLVRKFYLPSHSSVTICSWSSFDAQWTGRSSVVIYWERWNIAYLHWRDLQQPLLGINKRKLFCVRRQQQHSEDNDSSDESSETHDLQHEATLQLKLNQINHTVTRIMKTGTRKRMSLLYVITQTYFHIFWHLISIKIPYFSAWACISGSLCCQVANQVLLPCRFTWYHFGTSNAVVFTTNTKNK